VVAAIAELSDRERDLERPASVHNFGVVGSGDREGNDTGAPSPESGILQGIVAFLA
jgi:hypothetical protein